LPCLALPCLATDTFSATDSGATCVVLPHSDRLLTLLANADSCAVDRSIRSTSFTSLLLPLCAQQRQLRRQAAHCLDCLTAGAALLGAIGLTAPLCVRVRGRWSDVADELLRLTVAPVRASDDGLLCDRRFHILVLSYQRHSLQTNRSQQCCAAQRSASGWSQWVLDCRCTSRAPCHTAHLGAFAGELCCRASCRGHAH
jgi:hypothetical protein